MAFNSNFVSTPTNELLSLEGLRWSHVEKHQPHRNPFSKDRDRILYSKSFLRLRGKTQVFMLQRNDYIRTRLTHSLEVNQLAKSIASSLGQNLDLVEAIALGHDVGHTPFGHVGERTLAGLLQNDVATPQDKRGFKHNLQALRLYCDLEKGADFPSYNGLNLTKYTLWGIAHHSSVNYKKDENGYLLQPLKTDHPIYDTYLNAIKDYWSFEGYIVGLADEIAQRHHDIEDGLRYGMIDREELLEQIKKFKPLFGAEEKQCFQRLDIERKTLEEPVFNSLFSRLVINMYITNAVNNIRNNFREFEKEYDIVKQETFQKIKPILQRSEYENRVALSNDLQILDIEFQKFLKTRILKSYQAQAMDGKAEYIVRKLFDAFKDNPSQLPDTSIFSYARFIGLETHERAEVLEEISKMRKTGAKSMHVLRRCIVDYIGGMTDQFAYNEFDRLYGTKV